MTTQHTPTPWKAIQPVTAGGWWVVTDSDGHELGSGDGGLEHADATFIVRACNAHDELVAALRNVEGYLREGENSAAFNEVRAALAKAKARS